MPNVVKCPRCFNELEPRAMVLTCPCCGYRDLLPLGPQANDDTIICGLDLGKTSDHAAFTGWKRTVEPKSGYSHYAAVVIHRWPLGTSYSKEIVPQTVQFMTSSRLSRAFLAVDYGQVGSAIVELLEPGLGGRLDAVQSTGGKGYRYDEATGHWNVSKIFLCSNVQKLLSAGRIHVRTDDSPAALKYPKLSEASLAHVPQLKNELLNFHEKHNPKTGGTSYGAKQDKIHDDLAMSTAIVLFVGERGGFGTIDPTPNDDARMMVTKAPAGLFDVPADNDTFRGGNW